MQTNPQLNNLSLLHRDRGYRWTDDKPRNLLYQVRIAINNSGRTSADIQQMILATSGTWMTKSTIDNLMNGKTKSPQLRTVTLIMQALGYTLRWTKG